MDRKRPASTDAPALDGDGLTRAAILGLEEAAPSGLSVHERVADQFKALVPLAEPGARLTVHFDDPPETVAAWVRDGAGRKLGTGATWIRFVRTDLGRGAVFVVHNPHADGEAELIVLAAPPPKGEPSVLTRQVLREVVAKWAFWGLGLWRLVVRIPTDRPDLSEMARKGGFHHEGTARRFFGGVLNAHVWAMCGPECRWLPQAAPAIPARCVPASQPKGSLRCRCSTFSPGAPADGGQEQRSGDQHRPTAGRQTRCSRPTAKDRTTCSGPTRGRGRFNTARRVQSGPWRCRQSVQRNKGLPRAGDLGYQPLVNNGLSALGAYFDGIGANGADGSARATAAFQASPGYEFARDQALSAVQRSAASRGGLAGGNLTNDILKTATGLADQTYQQHLDNLKSGVGIYSQGVQGLANGLTTQGGASQSYGNALSALGTGSGQHAGQHPRTGRGPATEPRQPVQCSCKQFDGPPRRQQQRSRRVPDERPARTPSAPSSGSASLRSTSTPSRACERGR